MSPSTSCCWRVSTLLCWTFGFWVATNNVHAADKVVDESHGFKLTLPEGFSPHPALMGTAPEVIHGFIKGDPNDEVIDTFLVIESMRGPIGRERLRPEDIPADWGAKLSTTHWHQFEVDVMTIAEQVGDTSLLTYNAQIPLKRAAIQVKVVGTADREAELKQLLDQVLEGLQGESNWLQSALPAPKETGSNNYGYVLLAVIAFIVLGGLLGLVLIAPRTPKGTVLGIAVFLWFFSWGFQGNRIREVVMLTGALRMLGFAGGLFGIYDLIRKRTVDTTATGKSKSSTKRRPNPENHPE